MPQPAKSENKKAGIQLALLLGGGVILFAALAPLLTAARHRLWSRPATPAPAPEPAQHTASGDSQLEAVQADQIRESRVTGVRVVRALPRNERELNEAHSRAKRSACERIAPNQPLSITGYIPVLTPRDARRDDPLPSRRDHLLSIGLRMLSRDEARLPKLSGAQIKRYLRDHYVMVQARVLRDPVTQIPYLHDRPLAFTAGFRGNLTLAFNEAVGKSVQDMRGLGLLLAEGEEPVPSNLRTLVMIHRYNLSRLSPRTGREVESKEFEFVFVRAQPTSPTELQLHTFVTSDSRTVLHQLHGAEIPARSRDCGIQPLVHFTRYSHADTYPVESATRGTHVRSRASFPLKQLHAFADSQGWGDDAFECMDRVLDAIIDKRVAAESESPLDN